MKVLIVKMSSLGDVVHTLPALTDAAKAIPDISFDWVVEEAFAPIAVMHPSVGRVIEVAIRRWRTNLFKSRHEIAGFRAELKKTHYDLVIDPQGLIKSAAVALMANGPRCGYGSKSAKESLASFAYGKRINTSKGLHAIEKIRYLFAGALGYAYPGDPAEYGLEAASSDASGNELMFLHGTTWPTKHWPQSYWRSLAQIATGAGYRVVLPHGNDEEAVRAHEIAGSNENVEVMDRVGIRSLMDRMQRCRGVISVDTGLGHLACAIDLPLVGLYGPTDPVLTGPVSRKQRVLSSHHLPCIPCLSRSCLYDEEEYGEVYPPCFKPLNPETVWQALIEQLDA